MSFTLLLLPTQGALPSFNDLADWARAHGPFCVRNEGATRQLQYLNPDTGVAFSLEHIRAEEEEDQDVLELVLEYCRPSFFALECLSVLDDLTERFKLDVINPHGSAERERFDRTALLASWKEGNRTACAELKEEGEPRLHMPEVKAVELWRYLQLRPQVQQMEEDFVVPRPTLVRHKDDRRVLRLAELPRPALWVAPPVDLYLLENDRVVRAERVHQVLGPYLTDHDVWPWLKILDEQQVERPEVRAAWNQIFETATSDYLRADLVEVGLDAFVDVEV